MFKEMVPTLKGWLTVYGKNALTDKAKQIIVYVLAGEAWKLSSIKVVKAGSVLATTPSMTYSFGVGDDNVTFRGRFDTASFNDTLDEVRLMSLGGEIFSRVTGLSITKDNTLELEVIWKLTVA